MLYKLRSMAEEHLVCVFLKTSTNAVSSLAKPSIRLNIPILAPDSGSRIKEIGWIILVLNSKKLVIIGSIKRLLPIWLIEVGLFEMRVIISLVRLKIQICILS